MKSPLSESHEDLKAELMKAFKKTAAQTDLVNNRTQCLHSALDEDEELGTESIFMSRLTMRFNGNGAKKKNPILPLEQGRL